MNNKLLFILSFLLCTLSFTCIPCNPTTSLLSPLQIQQQLHGLCKYKNLKYPDHNIWGMDMSRRQVVLGEGSYGKVFALPNNMVYKEMKIEMPENIIKGYMEVAVSGCLSEIDYNFASAKDCYYFKTGRPGADDYVLYIWLLMDRYPMNLKDLLVTNFKRLYDEGGVNNKTLIMYKRKLMKKITYQMLLLKKKSFKTHTFSGIQHRDIKPDNIMLDENFEPHLGDFGFATFGPLTHDKIGTPEYSAPELLPDSRSNTFGFEIDIFSLGVLFYEIINSTSTKYVSAGSHYSMREGKQNPFCQIDFPGFEWMVSMVDVQVKKRMTIEEVYSFLNSDGEEMMGMQAQVTPSRVHQKKIQPTQESHYKPTIMDQEFNMKMEQNLMKKREIMDQQKMKPPMFGGFQKKEMVVPEYEQKAQVIEAYQNQSKMVPQGYPRQENIQAMNQFGQVKRKHSVIGYQFNNQMQENTGNLFKNRRVSVNVPKNQEKIEIPSSNINPSVPRGNKVIQNRNEFRDKIYGSKGLWRLLV
jgi:serine/threonine protein kinase